MSPLILKVVGFWNAMRTLWMTCLFLIDLRALALLGDRGPYAGIGIDGPQLFQWAAMPLKMACVYAGFSFGRLGEIMAEILSASAYCIVAIVTWRCNKAWTIPAIVIYFFECLLLINYLHSVYFMGHLFRAWPDLRPTALLWGWLFLTVDLAIAIYLSLPGAGRPLAQNRLFGTGGGSGQG